MLSGTLTSLARKGERLRSRNYLYKCVRGKCFAAPNIVELNIKLERCGLEQDESNSCQAESNVCNYITPGLDIF